MKSLHAHWQLLPCLTASSSWQPQICSLPLELSVLGTSHAWKLLCVASFTELHVLRLIPIAAYYANAQFFVTAE
jgi:hypothetical protein